MNTKKITPKMSMQERVLAILKGEIPDRLPFIDRIEFWYNGKQAKGIMPPAYNNMSLQQVHKAVGIGQQKFSIPYAFKLCGVEMQINFENELIYKEGDPVLPYFPAQSTPEQIPRDRPGTSIIEYKTPIGCLRGIYVLTESMINLGGLKPYLKKHFIEDNQDYRTVEYILERAAYVPLYDNFYAEERKIGSHGFVVPCIHRIPFQQALLEYLGAMKLFHALYHNKEKLDRLIQVLDLQMVEILNRLVEIDVPYIEFGDNLDGMMTNPNLFKEYCLPQYQKYADILHSQGKKVGSHTDGNLKYLADLLPESGLDICESFTPAPLTDLAFEAAWESWQEGPIIWGGIPSDLLESRTKQSDFEKYIDNLLRTVGRKSIIIGIGDMVLDNNLIDRVKYIAEKVEAHHLADFEEKN
jgi:hypothetical protein